MIGKFRRRFSTQTIRTLLILFVAIAVTHGAAYYYILQATKVPIIFYPNEISGIAKTASEYGKKHGKEPAKLDAFAAVASHSGVRLRFEGKPRVTRTGDLSSPMAALQRRLRADIPTVRISEKRRKEFVNAEPGSVAMVTGLRIDPKEIENISPSHTNKISGTEAFEISEIPVPLLETARASISMQSSPGLWVNIDLEGDVQRAPSYLLGFIFAISALFIMLVVYFQMRPLARGIGNLREAFDKFDKFDTLLQVQQSNVVELSDLETAFNRFSRQAQKSRTDQTAVLNAITHDLLTPIASLRIRSEFVGDAKLQAEMCRTLDEMRELTHSILDVARGGAIDEDKSVIDLTSLVEAMVDDAADLGRNVKTGPLANARCLGKPTELKRMIQNLLDNAQQYAGEATVSIEKERGKVHILVDDNGRGIPEDQLQIMLRPFTRLEKSRNRGTGGYGLGLSIADAIATRHGGTLTLENRTGKGLRAKVVLPTV